MVLLGCFHCYENILNWNWCDSSGPCEAKCDCQGQKLEYYVHFLRVRCEHHYRNFVTDFCFRGKVAEKNHPCCVRAHIWYTHATSRDGLCYIYIENLCHSYRFRRKGWFARIGFLEERDAQLLQLYFLASFTKFHSANAWKTVLLCFLQLSSSGLSIGLRRHMWSLLHLCH